MPFSRSVGHLFKDLLNLETTLIHRVFDSLESPIDVEELDYQTAFIKLLSNVLYQTSSLGDSGLAETIVTLFNDHRLESWAQCLIVQILSDSLSNENGSVLIAMESINDPQFSFIVSNISKEVRKQPVQKSLLIKYPRD